MPVRLGLPSPRISTKLYGMVALFLAMIYAVATAAIQFAGQAENSVSRYKLEGIGYVTLAARLQVLLEQHRRMVATAPFASQQAIAQDERVYHELNATIAGIIDGIAPDRAEKLSERFALLASQGDTVFEFARLQQRDEAAAAGVRYASAADGLTLEVLTEQRRRAVGAEDHLGDLAAQARSLTTWVGAAAILTVFLVGPLCLLLLRRMLARTQGIGSALIRLARNDTSVDIPGTADQDEFGQLARSVAVFKAKSIELLGKKADFERLNLQLDAAINNMPLGLTMFDTQERLLMCNKRYADMYELPGELTRPGTALCALWEHRTKKGARHSEPREVSVNGAALSPSLLVEFGSSRIIEVSRQPLKSGGWISLHEDITERRRQEEKIAHLARHDPLTDLANRMLFRERLEDSRQQLVHGRGFAVLCLDLDHFKAVNDTLGHPIGDALLKQVSQRLLSCVRHGDVVARLGGDEFSIMQTGVRDPRQTGSLAARIVETVGAPYEIDGNRIDIGTSVGIALAPRDGTDAGELMKKADMALYRAKGSGRGGFSFFKAEMHAEALMRRNLEVDLRKALEQETLELSYQPIVCLKSVEPIGFEALLRWHHPERGLIRADEFAAIAEDIGLTAEFGGWALRQACVQAARWPEPIHAAIDVSLRQFLQPSLTENMLQALAQSGLSPQRLEIEISEAVLEQGTKAVSTLHQLRQLGIRITLDDFGAGNGSLSALRAFPFDKIKIGRALIADIARSDDARMIVEAVIDLGTRLRMTVLAEGIEDFDQLSSVRNRGCTAGQGFLLGPPMTADKVDSFLAARAADAEGGTRALVPAALNPASAETGAQQASSQAA